MYSGIMKRQLHIFFKPLAYAVLDWTSRALSPYRYDGTLHKASGPLAEIGLRLI